MNSTRWWWVRHAPSAGSPGIIHGQDNVDADLTNHSIIEARMLMLPKDAVWLTSGLPRTVQTADALGGVNCRSVTGLMEQDFGDWIKNRKLMFEIRFMDFHKDRWILTDITFSNVIGKEIDLINDTEDF